MNTGMHVFRITYHDPVKGKWFELPPIEAPNAGAAWAAIMKSQLNFDEVNIVELGPAPKAVYLPAEQAHV